MVRAGVPSVAHPTQRWQQCTTVLNLVKERNNGWRLLKNITEKDESKIATKGTTAIVPVVVPEEALTAADKKLMGHG